jgi:hypothetical protein
MGHDSHRFDSRDIKNPVLVNRRKYFNKGFLIPGDLLEQSAYFERMVCKDTFGGLPLLQCARI